MGWTGVESVRCDNAHKKHSKSPVEWKLRMMDEIWHMRIGFSGRRDRYLWCRLGMMSKIEYGVVVDCYGVVVLLLLLDEDLDLTCWRL